MSYKLWIDDDAGRVDLLLVGRDPPQNTGHWIIARSSKEAIDIFKARGIPYYISFDHDLGLKADGTEDTAKEICKYLFERFPKATIDYEVHSRNPDGANWIVSYMESWKKSLEK